MADHPAARLSPMQQRCLHLTYERHSGGEIAQLLSISKSTVETHLAQARKTLGVTTSVRAAIIYHDYQASCAVSSNTAPVVDRTDTARPEPTGGGAPWWRPLLPVRLPEEARNDLSIITRAVWIVQLTIAACIGFGMLAVGLRVVSDLAG